MADLKSKTAFGSKENLPSALEAGTIDEYDVAYLSNGEIAWVDKEKNIWYYFRTFRRIGSNVYLNSAFSLFSINGIILIT